MKRAALITIFIFTFYFGASAQVRNNGTSVTKPNPKLLDEFNIDNNEWHKVTIDLIVSELQKNPSQFGLIGIRNDINFRNRLEALRKFIAFRKADASRIAFLIVDEQKKDINIFISENCVELSMYENSVVIRATDLDRIKKLFRPKINRNRKN